MCACTDFIGEDKNVTGTSDGSVGMLWSCIGSTSNL